MADAEDSTPTAAQPDAGDDDDVLMNENELPPFQPGKRKSNAAATANAARAAAAHAKSEDPENTPLHKEPIPEQQRVTARTPRTTRRRPRSSSAPCTSRGRTSPRPRKKPRHDKSSNRT